MLIIKSSRTLIAGLLLTMLSTFALMADEPKAGDDKAPIDLKPPKALTLLTKENLEDIARVEIIGDNPKIIYVPIVHDGEEHSVSSGGSGGIESVLVRCQRISEYLYSTHGVHKILLEGIGKTLSDKYNSPKYKGRKLTIGDSKSVTFKVWYDLLNKNDWQLVPAHEKATYGPLTLLGSEYTTRVIKALNEARANGWFKTNEAFQDNQAAFTALTEEACKGYNEKRKAILETDPGLKNEYDITVIQRNKVFINNTLETKGPGIIMCGGGHIQDLIDQLNKLGVSYMIVIPKGIDWPPAKKDDKVIYADMLQLGCQLKECSLGFGDGGSVKIKLPIE
jgi:hypothetical protein